MELSKLLKTPLSPITELDAEQVPVSVCTWQLKHDQQTLLE